MDPAGGGLTARPFSTLWDWTLPEKFEMGHEYAVAGLISRAEPYAKQLLEERAEKKEAREA